MPEKFGGRAGKRGWSLKGSALFDEYRGQMRASVWPQHRKLKRTKAELEREERFRQAQLLTQYLAPSQQKLAIEATAGTPLLPRDILTQAMYGRLFAIQLDDGRTIYPMAARADISESLDILAQEMGDILVRGDQFWQPISPGPAGQVLTSNGPGSLPTYQSASGGVTMTRAERNFSWSTGAGFQAVPWDAAPINSAGLWSSGDQTKLQMPGSPGICRLSAGIWHDGGSTHNAVLEIRDGSGTVRFNVAQSYPGRVGLTINTGPFEFDGSEWFELYFADNLNPTIQPSTGFFFAGELL